MATLSSFDSDVSTADMWFIVAMTDIKVFFSILLYRHKYRRNTLQPLLPVSELQYDSSLFMQSSLHLFGNISLLIHAQGEGPFVNGFK